MRLTKENKQKIGARIRASAAVVMRKSGYSAVNIDAIMQGAGLTRGAFYAHFKSKSDLFQAVIRHEHPILEMLKARDGKTAQALVELAFPPSGERQVRVSVDEPGQDRGAAEVAVGAAGRGPLAARGDAAVLRELEVPATAFVST